MHLKIVSFSIAYAIDHVIICSEYRMDLTAAHLSVNDFDMLRWSPLTYACMRVVVAGGSPSVL
jgi:hypothetical protein